jgi:hypothetical protein
MTCTSIHIYNILALDTDRSLSAPCSRLQEISSVYDIFMYDNSWLILQCENSVETIKPEDQGPRISCQLSFFLLMPDDVRRLYVITRPLMLFIFFFTNNFKFKFCFVYHHFLFCLCFVFFFPRQMKKKPCPCSNILVKTSLGRN